jgi:hypothetical protein
MTTSAALHTTDALALAYGQAWNDHDLDAIMGMHADDMCFHLHLDGFTEASSPEDVRAQFGFFFAAFPDIHFATRRLVATENLFVHEFTITGTLAVPFPVGTEIAQPGTSAIAFEGVDVIPCRDGTVVRKDTYLDAVGLRAGLGLG